MRLLRRLFQQPDAVDKFGDLREYENKHGTRIGRGSERRDGDIGERTLGKPFGCATKRVQLCNVQPLSHVRCENI